MTVTADVFAAYLKCPTKCFLRAHGEVGSGNEYADWVRAESETHRVEGLRRLTAGLPADDCVSGTSVTENLKTAKWRLATDVEVRSHNLESRIQAVERIPPEGRGRAAQYIPVRFVFTNKLSADDKLVATFDALVWSEASGRPVALATIIHGDDHSALKVKTAGMKTRVCKLTERIAAILAAENAPDLVLNRHCGECEFRTRCREKAIEKDDLSLLAGMREKERKDLHSKGIFTVTQLSHTFRVRHRPKHLASKREPYHHSLKALAIREKKIHIVGAPQLEVDGTPVFFDVEGLPDRDFYYLIGVRTRGSETCDQHSLWANRRRDEHRIWREFLEILMRLEKPLLIHYGSYETLFLRRMMERYPPARAAREGIEQAATRATNLLSLSYGQVYFPTYSNSLKEIAGYLGFKWPVPIGTGIQALVWRHQWEASQTNETKSALVAYNAADCRALETVFDVLRLLVRSDASKPIGSYPLVKVPNLVTSYSRPDWREFDGIDPVLNEINRAAQWDYQRDRIFLRSKTKGAAKRVASKPHWRSVAKAEKTIVFPDRPFCPTCGRRSREKIGWYRGMFHEIIFGRSSVKQRIMEQVFRKFHCDGCERRFGMDERLYTRLKFGRNLIALNFYMTVELGIQQRRAARLLDRLFGVTIGTGDSWYLRRKVAAYYDETRRGMLERIAGGRLVHADETRARIKGDMGYVWVFTNLNDVAYVYSESRESDILSKTLGKFRGVLVSDFYAAYDSLECEQQKCLIHLMRDLNDELLGHPFDEDLRRMVHAFADLVKPMIATIDRYGLKSRHLKKHQILVERFYRSLGRDAWRSEVALKFRDRFEKNRHKLFTFLHHDGVTWNNNPAEHAVKAYAGMREIAQGALSPTSIDQELILLSIAESCRYRGVDFLDFLRSGEKDIEVFAQSQLRRQRAGRAAGIEAPRT